MKGKIITPPPTRLQPRRPVYTSRHESILRRNHRRSGNCCRVLLRAFLVLGRWRCVPGYCALLGLLRPRVWTSRHELGLRRNHRRSGNCCRVWAMLWLPVYRSHRELGLRRNHRRSGNCCRVLGLLPVCRGRRLAKRWEGRELLKGGGWRE